MSASVCLMLVIECTCFTLNASLFSSFPMRTYFSSFKTRAEHCMFAFLYLKDLKSIRMIGISSPGLLSLERNHLTSSRMSSCFAHKGLKPPLHVVACACYVCLLRVLVTLCE